MTFKEEKCNKPFTKLKRFLFHKESRKKYTDNSIESYNTDEQDRIIELSEVTDSGNSGRFDRDNVKRNYGSIKKVSENPDEIDKSSVMANSIMESAEIDIQESYKQHR